MPLTTEQLLETLNANLQGGGGGAGGAFDATQALALFGAATGTDPEFAFGAGFDPETLFSQEDLEFAQSIFGGGAAVGPSPAATVPPPGVVGPTGQFVTTGAPGELNAPFGADFLDPTLQLFGLLAQLQQQQQQFGQTFPETQRQFDALLAQSGGQFGQSFGEQQRQFDITSRMSAAAQLAGLRAQGPQSAAELAFAQAGMGLPALGGSAQNIQNLLGATTRGATGQTVLDFNTPQAEQGLITPQQPVLNIPNTLGGQQLAQLQGNPNLAGVLGSFAQASGNPDIFARSIGALLPSGFQPTGAGL